jgi:uncharacterized protein
MQIDTTSNTTYVLQRTALLNLTLRAHDTLRDNARQPVLTLLEDISEGVHDMLFAVCDKHRYERLCVKGFHESCADNLMLEM